MAIEVKISGNASGLKRAFETAKTSAKQTFGSIKSFASSLNGALSFVGIGAVTTAISNTVHELSTMSKQARSLGLTAKEYQALKYAADSANVSFESVASTLPKVMRKVSQLNAGNAEAKKVFDQLGMSADNFQNKTSGEIFSTVVAGLNGIEDHGRRTAAAMALFEEQGGKLLDFFADYQNNVKKFDRLGGGASSQLMRDAERGEQLITDATTASLATLYRSVEAAKRGDLLDYMTGGGVSKAKQVLFGMPDHRAEEEAVEQMEQRTKAKRAAKLAAEAEAAAQTAAAQAEIEKLKESLELKKKQIELGERGFAVYKAEADAAKKAGRALTDAEKEQIRQAAGELYDLTHPKKAEKSSAQQARQPLAMASGALSDQLRSIGGSVGNRYQSEAATAAKEQLTQLKSINAKLPNQMTIGVRA